MKNLSEILENVSIEKNDYLSKFKKEYLNRKRDSIVVYCIRARLKDTKEWLYKIGKSTDDSLTRRMKKLIKTMDEVNLFDKIEKVGFFDGDDEKFMHGYFSEFRYKEFKNENGEILKFDGNSEFFILKNSQEKLIEFIFKSNMFED